MTKKNEKINAKIKQLGQMLGMGESTSIKAKRTTENIIAVAVVAGAFLVLGSLLMPGGMAGNYYGGGSVRDFQLLLRGFF